MDSGTITVHTLRRAVGTRLYTEPQDLETTAQQFGHATRETTRVNCTI